tara:strand:- start:45 stop:389 length:345 start_codon:yes stop_codon:yes gene_type:complete
MMSIDNKRKYIYNNLKKLTESKNNIIYEYILNNKLKHSLNKNGLIINLSIISENDINNLYEIVNKNEINKDLFISNDLELFENNICEKINKKIIKKEYKNAKLNKLDIKILSFI